MMKVVDRLREIKDAKEFGELSKGLNSEFRVRFMQLLEEAPDHKMFVTDLVKICSTLPDFYIARQTANFHLNGMVKAGLVEIEDVELPQKTMAGRKKLQTQVTLKRNVKLYVEDL